MSESNSKPKLGRPPVPPEKKRKKVGFSLSPVVEAKAKEAATVLGITLSKFVEGALINEITRVTFGTDE